MKPVTPHDPLDDLIAAALHGELTPAERAQFDSRLQTDPAALAAYQEAQAMHDLLEKTHKTAQPDSAFEQRMVSGVRRKIQTKQHRETAWESLVAMWTGLKTFVGRKRNPLPYTRSAILVLFIGFILAGVALGPITNGIKQAKGSAMMQEGRQIAIAEYQAQVDAGVPNPVAKSVMYTHDGRVVEFTDADDAKSQTDITEKVKEFSRTGVIPVVKPESLATTVPQGGTIPRSPFTPLENGPAPAATPPAKPSAPAQLATIEEFEAKSRSLDAITKAPASPDVTFAAPTSSAINANVDNASGAQVEIAQAQQQKVQSKGSPSAIKDTPTPTTPVPPPATPPAAVDTRKLIRNAQLDLEVKSFQTAMDAITAQTKAAGGYVDTSNSQKGGNGKLQGTVVVKVLPQNLDDFLFKPRELGQVQNQSVSTDDVTKDYFDTQARLVNSQKMETQLQDLLKRENGKVSDLLQVERELARVRGDIEGMQGQLKLYDFQVQYATITIQLREKDLNQTAAYLLKEQDEFSLFATDVEGTFQKARQGAEDFEAQILVANLVHNSGSDVAAELTVMVAPDQIESFLAQVRGLGRVANFTRQTQRVAKDGGESDQPADQTLTEKDKVQVHLSIRSDDETRKQVALTVVAKAVDTALDAAKTAALANAGVEILSSSLNKTPQGQSTAQLSVRVPGKDYDALIGAFKGLGRTTSLSIQRNDNSGPGSNGDDAPVIVSLALTDDDTPLQETAMTVRADDVDAQSQQIKKRAAANGVEVKASNFGQQADGTQIAQMTFRLPMAKYPAFLESLKSLGKVESLTVQRADRPDQAMTDDTAPAEITLQLHNQRAIIADDTGLWATLRQTFGDGAEALFGSIRVIGVLIAFVLPWLVTLVLLAWAGRRIYVWRKNN